MKIHLDTHPAYRRDMVDAISALTGRPAEYRRAPTYAYRIGDVTVDRDGGVDYEAGFDASAMISMLIERGWLDPGDYDLEPDAEAASADNADSEAAAETRETREPQAATDAVDSETQPEAVIGDIDDSDSEPVGVYISIPMRDWTVQQVKNLLRLVCGKQLLVRGMTGSDVSLDRDLVSTMSETDYASIADLQSDLETAVANGQANSISFADGNFTMNFPSEAREPAKLEAICELMGGMMRVAENATRVSLDSKATEENEKFYAQSWLEAMGFKGAEHKAMRAALLGHLRGYAAFKNEADMEAHRKKYAGIRKARRAVAQTAAEVERQTEADG